MKKPERYFLISFAFSVIGLTPSFASSSDQAPNSSSGYELLRSNFLTALRKAASNPDRQKAISDSAEVIDQLKNRMKQYPGISNCDGPDAYGDILFVEKVAVQYKVLDAEKADDYFRAAQHRVMQSCQADMDRVRMFHADVQTALDSAISQRSKTIDVQSAQKKGAQSHVAAIAPQKQRLENNNEKRTLPSIVEAQKEKKVEAVSENRNSPQQTMPSNELPSGNVANMSKQYLLGAWKCGKDGDRLFLDNGKYIHRNIDDGNEILIAGFYSVNDEKVEFRTKADRFVRSRMQMPPSVYTWKASFKADTRNRSNSHIWSSRTAVVSDTQYKFGYTSWANWNGGDVLKIEFKLMHTCTRSDEGRGFLERELRSIPADYFI